MNFSLARLLTSFEAPSSGLDHLFTPVAGVCCSPERKQTEVLVYGKISSRKYYQTNLVILPILESQSRRTQRPYVQRVKLYRAHRLNTEIVFQLFTGRAVIFPGKVQFHHSLHLIKRQAESEIYTFWKVFSIENTISGQKYS